MLNRTHLSILTMLAMTIALAACDSAEQESRQDTADKAIADTEKPLPPKPVQWSDFTERFLEDYFAANPTEAVYQGLHQYDGLLPDYSPSGQRAYIRRLRGWIGQLENFDTGNLSEMERFERDFLLSELREQKFWMEEVGYLDRNPISWAQSASPSVYISRDYAPLHVRMQAFTTYLENLPPYLANMRMTINGDVPHTWLETSLGMFGGFRDFFDGAAREAFAEIEDPDLQDAFNTAMADALAALDETIEWLEEQEAGGEYALGRELYAEMLWQTSHVDTDIERLKAIGEADLERNLDAMSNACAEFAPGSSLIDCAAAAKRIKPDEGPVDGAKRQLGMLKEFVVENDIVSIPRKDPVTVDEAPPYNRFNLAYIEIPGPYEKTLPSTYYIAPPDPAWSEEQRLEYVPGEGDLLFVSVHEVWPGHFLHFLHAKNTGSDIRSIFYDYAYTEGWAHYTEEMMYEAGLGKDDPQMHIGQLTNALLRNVRFLTSIGLHAGDMTVDEAITMFQEKGLQDEGNAQQQAYRGTYDPGFLNYTLGKLMIRKLRDDYAGDAGRDKWKEFHDEFLSYASAPVPMVRDYMLEADEGELFALPAEQQQEK